MFKYCEIHHRIPKSYSCVFFETPCSFPLKNKCKWIVAEENWYTRDPGRDKGFGKQAFHTVENYVGSCERWAILMTKSEVENLNP